MSEFDNFVDPFKEVDLEESKKIVGAIVSKLSILNQVANVIPKANPINQYNFFEVESIDEADGVGKIGLKAKSFVFELRTERCVFKRNIDLADALLKNHGIAADDIGIEQLIDEQADNIISKTFEKIYEIADPNPFDIKFNIWDKIKSFVYRIFNKGYKKKFKVDNIRKIVSKLLAASNMIAVKGRFGPANYAIVSSGMSALLMDNGMYTFSSTNQPMSSRAGKYVIQGNIAGLVIITDYSMSFNDMTVYVGRKSSENEPGIFVAIQEEGAKIYDMASINPYEKATALLTRNAVVCTPNAEKKVVKMDFQLTGELKKSWNGK